MNSGWVQAVKGAVATAELDLILPHEHLFTDLRGPQALDYAQAEAQDVARLVGPYLEQAHAAGVTALVECSTVGVGRNLTVLRHLAEISPIHIIAPTGVYREPYIPSALVDVSAKALTAQWVSDLREGIEGSSIRAGFIKIAMSDDGPTALEIRNLKAAAMASRETGSAIVSHTPNGAIARRQIEIQTKAGLDLDRFIWAHANLEPDTHIHLQAARQGVYVSFDAVGAEWQPQEDLIAFTLALIEAGCVERILLSHDAGWYDPSQPDGQPEGGFRGYTELGEVFIPMLRARGVTDDQIHLITVTNPARALAMGGD